VPLMVTRLMLSLKKAANAPTSVWSLADAPQPGSVRFAHHTIGGTERPEGDISMRNLSMQSTSGLPQEP
jgi:hypothetical protein